MAILDYFQESHPCWVIHFLKAKVIKNEKILFFYTVYFSHIRAIRFRHL